MSKTTKHQNKEKKTRVSFQLTGAEYAMLRQLAAANHRSVAGEIRAALANLKVG